MKLFSKSESHSNIKLENEQLIESNIRLRKFYKEILTKINGAKTNYEPDKVRAMEEFEQFAQELAKKKSTLLQELIEIQNEIKKQKDIYYGVIAKQDALDEKIYQMNEQEDKLEKRQLFVEELERKWNEKAYGKS